MVDIIWQQFLAIVKEEVGSRVVETWLKAVLFCKWDAIQKKVYLKAPNSFVQEWIRGNYLPLIDLHLSRLLNVDTVQIIFVDSKNTVLVEEHKIIPAQLASGALVPDKKNTRLAKTVYNNSNKQYTINKNYLFDTFIVGPSNQMAHAAAYAITQKPGNLYNPFFIYGGSGLGKTHLLHAIANQLKTSHKGIEVLYQPTERFVSEFIHAIRFDKIHQFQQKYKNIDVLLFDDVQCMSNKEQTQEAFFNIFNTLYDSHKQIVFSSDSYPADIDGLAERLRSRLAWGLVADVQVPAVETKIAILKRKAELSGEQIPDDVAHFIAASVASNVRELEGALIRISAFAELTKQPVTLDLAKKVLLNRIKERADQLVDFDRIVKSIGNYYSYSLADFRSRNRTKQLALARQLAMYFMKKFTDKSLHEIAGYLGRTDHSTVIHALKQVQERIKTDALFSNHVDRLRRDIIH